MHEVTIAQDLLRIIEEETKKHGATRVTRVLVRIGVLSYCVPDSLDFAFTAVSHGTIAEGAKLEIESVPARGKCSNCNEEFPVTAG